MPDNPAGSVHKFKPIFKNTSHQQMHKQSFIINCNTVLHFSTLLGHLQGELFVIVTLRLHFIDEREYAVQARTAESSRLQKQRSTQSTAHSHSTVNVQP
jgi:hypothetical protein